MAESFVNRRPSVRIRPLAPVFVAKYFRKAILFFALGEINIAIPHLPVYNRLDLILDMYCRFYRHS